MIIDDASKRNDKLSAITGLQRLRAGLYLEEVALDEKQSTDASTSPTKP